MIDFPLFVTKNDSSNEQLSVKFSIKVIIQEYFLS